MLPATSAGMKRPQKESKRKAPDFDADSDLKKFKEAFPDYQILNPDKESENAKQLLAFFKTLYPENVLDKVGEFIDKCLKIKNDFHQSKMSLQYMKDKYNELNYMVQNQSPVENGSSPMLIFLMCR